MKAGNFAGWQFRKKITIHNTPAQDNLTDFPVLVSINSDADLASHAQPDGDDIIFTDASDTRLDHEIEVPFDSSTGTFVAWVRVPRLSATADTVIYMYYGNPTIGNQENPGGLWNSSYRSVWHLHDDFLDSTSNGNNATNNGSTDTVGKIADGQHFDGTTNYIDVPDHGLGPNSDWTVSFWFYADSSSGNSYHYIISTGTWAGLNTLQVWQPIITGEIAARLIDSDGNDVDLFGHAGGNYLDDTWHLAHVVWDASLHHLYLYIDGSLYSDEGNANVDTGSGTTNELAMGARQDHAADRFLMGGLDEIRISAATKTAGWIETEYTNQDDPNSFYTVGSELEENQCEDDTDCGFCEKCDAGICIVQTDSEDLKGECPARDCITGFCDGARACGLDPPGTTCTDDGNACTDDECDGAGVCTHPFLISGTTCGDPSDNDCTDPDTCDGAGICWDNHASAGTSCDDGIYCNGTDTCSGGICMHAGDPCSDDGEFCNGTESCNETLENCTSTGDPCTPPEVCDEGINLCMTIPPGGWWKSTWLHRKPLTINPANVDTDLTDFPVLIDFTDDDVSTYAQISGNDLAFTDYNGVQLSHEIELYNNVTGHVIAWVRVPYVSSTEDTVLYLYFGNSLANNQEDVAGTWDSSYVMVQHLDEASGDHEDSTGYLNNSDLVVVTEQDADGTIDGADEFAGTLTAGDYIRIPDASSLQFDEGSFTAEAWIYPRSVPDTTGARIVNNRGTGGGGSYPGWHMKIKDFSGQWSFGDSGIDDANANYINYEGTIRYNYNQWYQMVMVYEADTELRFYVNGAPDGALSVGDYGSIANTLPTIIGASIVHEGIPGADDKQFFDGIIDEVRLSDTARSADWIAASYSSQNDPGGFYLVGDLEFSTGPPTVPDPEPADGAIDVSTALTALRFTINDPDGDLMDYTVTTSPDIGSATVLGVPNGTYSVAVSGLDYETTYQWDISVDDGSGIINETYTFTTEKAPAAWWDSAWIYRREILLDHTDVTEDLNNFPVLITIDDGTLLSNVQDDADDIVFTDYDGSQLYHEVESYDPSTGALVAWVSVPFLSSTEDTQIYLYYGNSEATNQENAPLVWDSNYVMVQHLDETSGTHFDSTGNPNDGTPYNLASQDALGKVDGADEFDALEEGTLIDVGTNVSLDVFGPEQDFSIFLWVKRDTTTGVEGFFSSGSSGEYGIYFGSAYQNQDDLKFMSIDRTVESESTTGAIGDTEWHHVGVTADRDGNLTFWADAVSVHSESIAGSSTEDWNRLDDTYKIGNDRSELSPMDGIIDEVRISDMVRSAGWIQTSYTNQNDPGAFYLLGDVESETDTDDDGIPDYLDNCSRHANPGQEDTFPPDGNGIGDACDCEGDFDCSTSVDADDVVNFLFDFGRSPFNNPCTNERFCYGDFDCNRAVDADDVSKFLEDFGRSQYNNPCPPCEISVWCVYP
jgi:hypothetical protein